MTLAERAGPMFQCVTHANSIMKAAPLQMRQDRRKSARVLRQANVWRASTRRPGYLVLSCSGDSTVTKANRAEWSNQRVAVGLNLGGQAAACVCDMLNIFHAPVTVVATALSPVSVK